MTLTEAKALIGLYAGATPTGTNVANNVVVGRTLNPVIFSDADIAYSFKVAAAAANNVATLTIVQGSVAQTTGSPTITDGDGNDFEGVDIPTMVTLYGMLFEATAATDTIAITQSSLNLPALQMPSGATSAKCLWYETAGITVPGTTTITFGPAATSGDSIEVTVIGKSS